MYARKSTKGKDKQVTSIGDQISFCRKYANEHKLKVYPNVFKEKGSAMKSDSREVFEEILKEITKPVSKRRFNSILAWHPDRLARNMKDAGEIIDLLDRGIVVNLQFASYTFQNDSNGKMALGIQFVLAKQYSENLSTHTTRGNEGYIERGQGLRDDKFGYKLDGNKYYRPDGKNFEILKNAFELGIKGISHKEIAEYLNSKNFTFLGKQVRFVNKKVSKLFLDPFYCGFHISGKLKVYIPEKDQLFKPIITPEEFYELRKRIDSNRSFERKRTGKLVLLRNLVYCSFCGSEMMPSTPSGNTKNYLYLSCKNKNCLRYTEVAKGKDKLYKRQPRSKIVFDFVREVLPDKFPMTRKEYDKFLLDSVDEVKKKREKIWKEILTSKSQIASYTDKIDKKTDGLSKIEDRRVIDNINTKVQELVESKTELEEFIKGLKVEEEKLSRGLEVEYSYEEFLNLYNNLVRWIKESDNSYMVDKALKTVFLNFSIDSSKVVFYEAKPPFNRFINKGTYINGVGGGIRTLDLLCHRQAL